MLLLLGYGLPGQTQLRLLDMESPLSPSLNAYLSQTSDGFYWLGGQNGLLRFDGTKHRRQNLENTSEKIKYAQNIQSDLFEEEKDIVWFSTFNAFHRLNLCNGRTENYQLQDGETPITTDYTVFHLDRKAQQLYLRAGKNIYRFGTRSKQQELVATGTEAKHFAVAEDAEGRPTRILGMRWISTGLEVIDPTQKQQIIQIDSAANALYFHCALALTKEQWIVGTRSGLYLVNTAENQTEKMSLAAIGSLRQVVDLAQTKKGHIYASIYRQGIIEIGKDLRLKGDIHRLKDLPSSAYTYSKILVTNDDNLLIALPGNGFATLSTQTSAITVHKLPGRPVKDIKLDQNQQIQVLSLDGMLHTWDQSQWRSNDQIKNLGISAKKLVLKKDQTSVIGKKSLVHLSHENGSITKHAAPEKIVFFGGSPATHTNDFLLLSNRGLENSSYGQEMTLKTDLKISLPNDQFFFNIYPLPESHYLLSEQGTQVWEILVSPDMRYQVINKFDLFGWVNTFYRSKKGGIYVATNTGLYQLENQRATLLFSGDEMFPNLNILSVIESPEGKLWLGTDRGLFAYSPQDDQYIYFSTADGLPSNKFLPIPGVLDDDNKIWLATDDGLIHFSPTELLNAAIKNKATPYFDDFRINGYPIKDSIVDHKIRHIQLPYHKKNFRFKPAVVALQTSPLSSIGYQLIGQEQLVSYVKPGIPINYSNIEPGSYTLKLQAVNHNGLPTESRQIRLEITPPFWETWWFRLLVFVSAATLLWAIYALLLRRERLKQLRLRQQQARIAAERDRIAGEVHDDLGGQLSSIMYLSEELLLTEAVPGTERELSRINELSRSSLQNVRDIIFALDNRRSTLANLGDQFRGAGDEFFRDRKILYDYAEELRQPDFVLTSRQKRNLTLVVKEAWHNIAKHAKAEQVDVRLNQQNGALHITVADNGRGFSSPKSAVGTGGYGLDNMQEKITSIGGALTIDSTPGAGTKLTISWPLSKGNE